MRRKCITRFVSLTGCGSSGAGAADLSLDGVELGYPAQALGCDVGAADVVDLAEPALGMTPTEGPPQRHTAPAARSGQPVVAGIAVDLENAVGAAKQLFGVFAVARHSF